MMKGRGKHLQELIEINLFRDKIKKDKKIC